MIKGRDDRMRRFMMAMLVLPGIILGGCASATSEGAKVRIAKTEDEVFGCQEKGPVEVKTAIGLDEARVAIRNRAAALGANYVRIDREVQAWGHIEGTAFDCDPAKTRSREQALVDSAGRVIACTAGPDCEYKWSRAMQWLQQNSSWKFRTVTDTLLTTEGPLDTAKPAFEVTKIPQGDGRNYQVAMRAWCGAGNCEDLILRLRSNFNDFVLVPPPPMP
jgi:hypothetical protein